MSGLTFCIFPVDCPRCALLSSTKFSSKRCDICRVFSAWSVSLLRISVKSLSNDVITEFFNVRFFKKRTSEFQRMRQNSQKCIFFLLGTLLCYYHILFIGWLLTGDGVKSNLLKSTYPAFAQPTTASIFPSNSASFSLLDFSLCSSMSLVAKFLEWLRPTSKYFRTNTSYEPDSHRAFPSYHSLKPSVVNCPSLCNILSKRSGTLIYLQANLL